ncbi:hypothetical protein DV738_g4170, partial [Chaetothyriales sp. CBS 135597]
MKTRLARILRAGNGLDNALLLRSFHRCRCRCRYEHLDLHRAASTLTSATAINAPDSVPAQYKDLYAALTRVRHTASPFVSLSRLQLAQQGLQSSTPKFRVAVLGLDTQETARRLVRLLLADALEQEAVWEKELGEKHAEQGVLLAYGQPPSADLPPPRTAVPTVYIPSPLLRSNNLEILITSINSLRNATERAAVPSGTLLDPSINTPTAASGRHTVISQPVHASLLVSNGLDDFLASSDLLAHVDFSSQDEKASVSTAVELSGSALRSSASVLILDLSKAEEGLAAIRRSLNETPRYAHEWKDSGMLEVSKWFADTSALGSEDQVPESVRRLISTLLASASRNIDSQSAPLITETSAISLATKTNLEAAVDDFSRNAHQELQSGLASAWSSRNWRKLAWYKLIWRVDDVGLITTDLISNAWLPRTERAVYELSGRMAQVGISPVVSFPSASADSVAQPELAVPVNQTVAAVQTQLAVAADATSVPPVITTSDSADIAKSSTHSTTQPLSNVISSIRSATIDRAVNELTFTAQQLLFRTLSISGLTAALSGLTYVSFTTSLYEAGTIFAVGTALALYRMQGGWIRATKALEKALFDEGRRVIQNLVGRMRQLVDQANESPEEDAEIRRLNQAKDSVRQAQDALDKLASGKTRRHVDHFVRAVKHHNYARTNQFEVHQRLIGLEEKFQVLNNDDLSDALRKRPMTEIQAMREVLFMAQGFPTALFHTRGSSNLRPDVKYRLAHLHDTSFNSILQAVVQYSAPAHQIRRWLQHDQSSPVMQALQSSVQEVLDGFDQAMNGFHQRLLDRADGVASLQAMVDLIRKQAAPLLTVRNLLVLVHGRSPIDCLDAIHNSVSSAQIANNPQGFRALLRIFQLVFKKYAEAQDHHDKSTLWSAWFTLSTSDEANKPPRFLANLATRILVAGKARVFLRHLSHNTLTSMSSVATLDTIIDHVCASTGSSIVPFAPTLSSCLDAWLASHLSASTTPLQNILHIRLNLKATLSSMSNLYFSSPSAGHITHTIDSHIFNSLDRGSPSWNDSFRLTDVLTSSFAQIPEFDVSRISISSRPVPRTDLRTARRSVTVLSNLDISYTLPWTIANMLTPSRTGPSYQRISLFLRQMRRALYCLQCHALPALQSSHQGDQGLRSSVRVSGGRLIRPLRITEGVFLFLHTITTTLYAHMTDCVIGPLTQRFHTRIIGQGNEAAQMIDDMIHQHLLYVHSLEIACLTALTKNISLLRATIIEILDICLAFSFGIARSGGKDDQQEEEEEEVVVVK